MLHESPSTHNVLSETVVSLNSSFSQLPFSLDADHCWDMESLVASSQTEDSSHEEKSSLASLFLILLHPPTPSHNTEDP